MVDLLHYSVDVPAVTAGAWARWRDDGWVKIGCATSDEWRDASADALAQHQEAVRQDLDPDDPNKTAEDEADAKWNKTHIRLFCRILMKDSRNITVGGKPVDLSDENAAYEVFIQPKHQPFWVFCQTKAHETERFTEKNVAAMAKNFEAACSGTSSSESSLPPS
jgi:hypothetical protein